MMMRMVEKGYRRLMLEILKDPRMKFPDYYEMLILLEDWEDVRDVFIRLPRVQSHMKQYIKKKNIESRLGYRLKKMENEEECVFCLEMLTDREKIVECKTCKLKLDVRCWKQWIREEKRVCLMCRCNWFQLGLKTKEYMKWTEYESLAFST